MSGTTTKLTAAVQEYFLDTDTPAPGVTDGALRPDLATIAVPATADGRNMTGADFAVAAGWGHSGSGGWRSPNSVSPSNSKVSAEAYILLSTAEK